MPVFPAVSVLLLPEVSRAALHMLLHLISGSAFQLLSSSHSNSANKHRNVISLSVRFCFRLHDIQA